LFIGRLPRETTTDDLRECFKDYAPLKDVYIPQNFRGFGFVTFGSAAVAEEALNSTHVIKGNYLNLSYPNPKSDQSQQQNMAIQPIGYGGMQGNMQGNNMQGGMQGYGGMQGGMRNGMHGVCKVICKVVCKATCSREICKCNKKVMVVKVDITQVDTLNQVEK